MITLIEHGDIFESKCEVITNCVNCEGAMGRGLALEFKKRYPVYYQEYREMCLKGQFKAGTVHLHKLPDTRPILSFATKDNWRNPSKIEWIEKGVQQIAIHAHKHIKSLALPALGCQNGGLDWGEVYSIIEKYLRESSLEVDLYAPL